jgi:hypothetical protein
MGMQYDVKMVHADANVQAIMGPVRVKAYQLAPGGTAGEIQFWDTAANSATGTERLTLNITLNTAVISTLIPGEGIRFNDGVYIVLPANASITTFYG